MTDPDRTDFDRTDLDQRLEAAKLIIADAAALALASFDRLDELAVRSKGVQDVVTEADVAVEHLIRDRLAAEFPTDAFLGEETGHADFPGSTGIWVVDPIDGTQPFVQGLRTWCVSMAYVRDGVVQFGLVTSPAQGETFVGGRAYGSTRNGQSIRVSSATGVDQGLTFLGCSARVGPEQVVPVLDRLLHAHGMFVRNGSGALGLCDVACGRLLGYVEPHINSWDCLGGIAIIEGAGGQVSDYLSSDTLLAGNRLVAGPPAVFAALDDILG